MRPPKNNLRWRLHFSTFLRICVGMRIDRLEAIWEKLRLGHRECQHEAYRLCYGFAMSVCIRYAKNREEAEEMVNDGFVKMFANVAQLQQPYGFSAWFRRILVNCAIDYHRKYHRLATSEGELAAAEMPVPPDVLADLGYEEKLKLVQALPPAYRVAFNMYAIEGYTTAEIAVSLNISEGTVRANVAKARARLQLLLKTADQIKHN